MTQLITKTDIISAFSYWGVILSPYVFPKNLQEALESLSKRIDKKKIFKCSEKYSMDSFLEVNEGTLMSLVKDLIFNTPEISIWNVTKMEQDKGITDYKDKRRTVKFSATSRYGKMQAEDFSFIDLDALRQNVCNMLWQND